MLHLPTTSRLIRFGTFQVDLKSGELHKQGLKIKLQEQPFRILAMLLEHAGDIVTREELRQRLWPDNTFVEFDQCLNKAINKIREALGDSAESPRFIETLPKRGYRFIAPIDGNSRHAESAAGDTASGRRVYALRSVAVLGIASLFRSLKSLFLSTTE